MLGGEWIDVTVFKDAFLEYAQVEAFNFLARNNVPQTDFGQQALIGALIKSVKSSVKMAHLQAVRGH